MDKMEEPADAVPSTTAGALLKSARKARGGHQSAATQLRSKIVEFNRRINVLNDRTVETGDEARMYLGSLESSRRSILFANIAVLDIIKAHFPDVEESENARMKAC